jgi:hypothetical protein
MRRARTKSFRLAVALGGVLVATICFGMGIARIVTTDNGQGFSPATVPAPPSTPPSEPELSAPSGQAVLRRVYAGRWSAYCRAITRAHDREDRLVKSPGLSQLVSPLRAELNTHHRFRQYLLSSSVPSSNRTFARRFARYIRAESRFVSTEVKASLSNDAARYLRAVKAQNHLEEVTHHGDDLARRVKYCRVRMY